MSTRPRLPSAILKSSGALALLAASTVPSTLLASPGSFTLPSPTPTPTSRPEVEGPADDTGVVPLAPRVIPTERPTPAPTASETDAPRIDPVLDPTDSATPDEAATGGTAVVQPLPTGSAGAPAQSAPQTQRQIATPTGETATEVTGETSAPTESAIPGLDSGTSLPTTIDDAPTVANSETAPASGDSAIPLWAWIAGGIAALLALIAGLFALRRRQSAAPVPEIEKPQVVPSPVLQEDAAIAPRGPARIDVALEVVSATRSVMNFTLDYRLTLANRDARAVRDVSVAAILTSAQKQVGQSGDLGFDRSQAETIERIGPSKSHVISGQTQLPTAKLQVMRQGNKPLFVPLLQVTIAQGEHEPEIHHYVVGLPSAANTTRLHPIPLDTPPGGIPGLRARELDVAPA